ncbi:hypothetical protein U1Q18_023767 [Sarracenia purpurea var. burkii]
MDFPKTKKFQLPNSGQIAITNGTAAGLEIRPCLELENKDPIVLCLEFDQDTHSSAFSLLEATWRPSEPSNPRSRNSLIHPKCRKRTETRRKPQFKRRRRTRGARPKPQSNVGGETEKLGGPRDEDDGEPESMASPQVAEQKPEGCEVKGRSAKGKP